MTDAERKDSDKRSDECLHLLFKQMKKYDLSLESKMEDIPGLNLKENESWSIPLLLEKLRALDAEDRDAELLIRMGR